MGVAAGPRWTLRERSLIGTDTGLMPAGRIVRGDIMDENQRLHLEA
jgi:hypothetical protein